jgi:hypothetical protein
MPEPVVTTVITALAGIVGALGGAILTHRFDQKQRNEEKEEKDAEEKAQLVPAAATVLGLVLTLVNDSHPMRARSISEAKRIRDHWQDVRNQVLSFAVRYPKPEVRELFFKLLDLVDNYVRHNANDEFRQKDSDSYFKVADNLLNEIKEILNRLRTAAQIEAMLDVPGEPRWYWGRGNEIVEEAPREKRLEEKAKNLKVGDTALLLRSGLKVTLLGIYRVEQVPQAGSKPFALEEGEVYLVARVVVENLIKHPFEVEPRQNFGLTGTHYPRGTLDLEWLREVAGEARAGSWEGKIRRGEEREGFLAYKMQKDGKARLVFRTVGELGPVAPYGAKAHKLVAVWRLGEVASLPTLPDAIIEEWTKEKNERKERIIKANQGVSDREPVILS